ncbi:MAG: Ig-like domain-containing protein [Gemmatimonadota bacterium]|nr:Ig-like domain-containing protein [Gemmatimonadota bacterium]
MSPSRRWQLAVFMLVAVACGSDRAPITSTEVKPDTVVTPPPVALAITVNGGFVYLPAGDSVKMFTAVLYAGQQYYRTDTLPLTIRDTSVARLDSIGYLHAGVRSGTTWVVVTKGTLSDSAVVNIWTPAFYLSPDTSVVPLGTSRTIIARSFSKSTGAASIAASGWTSSNASVVTVDEQGQLTPRSVGRATISASAGTARSTAEVFVTAYDHPLSFVSVKADFEIACGIEASGSAYCWGAGFSPTGTGSVSDRCEKVQYTLPSSTWTRELRRCALTPSKLPTALRFRQFDSLPSTGIILLSQDGDVYSAALNRLSASGTYRWATGQGGKVCGITTDSAGWCWGSNFDGFFGNGTSQLLGTTPTPQAIVGGLTWKGLYASSYNVCGLTTSNQAYCWGHNLGALLGVGPGTGPVGDCLAQCVVVPTAVRTDTRFTTLAVGNSDRCGIDLAGDTWCWGAPPTGVDPLAPGAAPARIASAPRFATLRGQMMCGLTADGSAYCMARDASATTMATRYSFARLPLPFAATQLDVGPYSPSCAISATNSATYCWGVAGGLGDGTLATATADRPSKVAGQSP